MINEVLLFLAFACGKWRAFVILTCKRDCFAMYLFMYVWIDNWLKCLGRFCVDLLAKKTIIGEAINNRVLSVSDVM